MIVQKRRQTGLKVSNFLPVIFQLHHGSEGVKTASEKFKGTVAFSFTLVATHHNPAKLTLLRTQTTVTIPSQPRLTLLRTQTTVTIPSQPSNAHFSLKQSMHIQPCVRRFSRQFLQTRNRQTGHTSPVLVMKPNGALQRAQILLRSSPWRRTLFIRRLCSSCFTWLMS